MPIVSPHRIRPQNSGPLLVRLSKKRFEVVEVVGRALDGAVPLLTGMRDETLEDVIY